VSPLTSAQRAIIDDTGANRCVTSGAGCGKTRVLVERYIRFLEEDLALGLERLAAITFTDAAAAQMRDRIRAACRSHIDEARKVAAGDSTGRAGDLRRTEAWLARYWDVDVAPIDTIHAFCAALLRRYAIEAGVDPGFSLLDDARATFLVQDVVRRTMEEILGQAGASPGGAAAPGAPGTPGEAAADLLAVLEHFSLDQAREVLAALVQEKREVLQRVAAPVMARSDGEILRDLCRTVDEKTFQALREIAEGAAFRDAVAACERSRGPAGDRREDARAAAMDGVRRLLAARNAKTAREAAEQIVGSVNLRGGSAKQWPSREDFDAAGKALGAIRDALEETLDALPAYDEDLDRRHLAVARSLYRTAARAIAAYEAAKREQSALDFEDLQIRARDLLKGNPRVLDDCRKRFRTILVDELQDTNLLQFEIVDLLASGPPSARRPGAIRPGALFGVGDPKQSIYRFRGAEFEVFQRALERVGPAGRKTLDESFRLHPGTAALVNHLFPPLMGDLYEPIRGMRPQRNDAVAEFLLVTDPKGGGFRQDEGLEHEAARLADRIKDLVENHRLTVEEDGAWRPARYGDVAILLRRMSYLHLYERALEGARVPYYVVAGSGFFKQQEVLDVLHLARVLDDPSDDLHLAGVLRSPFFAVSDEGLYRLRASTPARTGRRPGASLYESVAGAAKAGGLSSEDQRGLARAAALVPAWAAAKDRLGLAALLEETVFESGYAASAVGRFGGERAYANLRQMVELARRFEHEGLYSLGDYIEYLTDFLSSEVRAEQAPLAAPGSSAVRIMTIHKAKGLEFPVVALADLAHAVQPPRGLIEIHPATGVAVRLRDADASGRTSSALALARRDAAEAERAEAHRLLYVAMTRAKDFLIFASHQGQRYNRRSQGMWLHVLVEGFGLPREAGEHRVQLPGGHLIRASVQPPAGETGGRAERRIGPRDLLDEGRVAWTSLHERGQRASRRTVAKTLEILSPPPPIPQTPARITVTALLAYRRCPRLYWLTEVLGVDEMGEPAPAAGGTAESGRLLPSRTWGKVSHRAMELAAGPDEAAILAAVRGALREAPVGPGPIQDELRRRLAASVRDFWASGPGKRLAAARQSFREMPLVLAMNGAELRGVMDLVFQGDDGQWEVLDYKTSAPAPEAAPARQPATARPVAVPGGDAAGHGTACGRARVASPAAAAEYELQLGLYALAASRWLGCPVRRWTVYFLGGPVRLERTVGPDDLARVEGVAREALAGIAGRQFGRTASGTCSHCRFLRLCEGG
jgi:ATP-dependent helicase/nuclease subunit A